MYNTMVSYLYTLWNDHHNKSNNIIITLNRHNSCQHSGKESVHQYRRLKRHEFDPWVRKISWRKKWQATPVFLLEKFHGQRSLEGYSPWGRKESYTTERQSKGDSVSERMCMSIRRQAGGGENVSQTRYVCAAWEAWGVRAPLVVTWDGEGSPQE